MPRPQFSPQEIRKLVKDELDPAAIDPCRVPLPQPVHMFENSANWTMTYAGVPIHAAHFRAAVERVQHLYDVHPGSGEPPQVIQESVFRNGETVSYEVAFTNTHWAAVVRNADGDPIGTPAIVVLPTDLAGEDLEANVRSWIHGCIRDRVGVD